MKNAFVELAKQSTTDSSADSYFLQMSSQCQVEEAEHEIALHLDFQGHIKGQNQGQGTGYRKSFRNYVSTRTKVDSRDSQPL